MYQLDVFASKVAASAYPAFQTDTSARAASQTCPKRRPLVELARVVFHGKTDAGDIAVQGNAARPWDRGQSLAHA